MAAEQYKGNYAASEAAGSTTVYTGASRLVKLVVTTTPTTACTVFDNTAASGKVVAAIPASAAVGSIYELDVPCDTGITITVGTAGVVLVVYSKGKN